MPLNCAEDVRAGDASEQAGRPALLALRQHLRPVLPAVAAAQHHALLPHDEADLVVCVLDGTAPPTAPDRETVQLLRKSNKRVLYVANKVDNPDKALGAGERCEVVVGDALGAGALARCPDPVHLIFFDPPYALMRDGERRRRVLEQLARVMGRLDPGGFAALRALSTCNDNPSKASRPFDKDRDGFIIGEGAGILILEELEFARRRGATIYAEIVGYGSSADAYHITAPSEDGDGGVRVMKMAIRKAGIQPDAIDYINAHGTSTPYNDRLETMAIKKCFGDHAYKLAVSSSKSMTGHLLGAAGGLEAAVTVLAVHTQRVPPTINLSHPEDGLDLDYVPNVERTMPIRYALSNSFGFGGTNGALLFKRFEE